MSSLYFNNAGTLFENIFEPASGGNGVSDPGYHLPGGALMTFAPRALGSAAPVTGYGRTGGVGDVNTLWALKGSVSYLEPPSAFLSPVTTSVTTQTVSPLQAGGTRWNNAHVIGANDTAHGVYSTNSLMIDPTTIGTANCGFGNTSAAAVPNQGAYMQVVAHGTSDTLNASLTVSINADGTWGIYAYGTNGDMDTPTNGAFANPNPQQLIASGQWSGTTGAGIGASYTFSASFSNQKNFSYYAVGPGGSAGNTSGYSWSPYSTNSQYQYVNPGWNNGYGSGPVTSTSGAASGNLASNSVHAFNVGCTAGMALCRGSGGGSDYEAYGEDNWYHRLFSIDFQFVITSAGGQTLTGQIPLVIGMHWCQATYGASPAPTPAPTPGGGGGGGGCVAVGMYLQPDLKAGAVTPGRFIDGVSYNPDRVEPRMVDAVQFVVQPCYRMVTESDIEVIASDSTPMTMSDGSLKMFPDMLGELVLVDDDGDVHWETVKTLQFIGVRMVALISMDNQNYFAGTDPKRRIGTHNLIAPK